MRKVNNIDQLSSVIQQTNHFFLSKAQKQVNTALTLRNWLIGCYITEYEQLGEDRAEYGQKLLTKLAAKLKDNGLKGMAETNLKLFRQFYNLYPQIRQTLSDELNEFDSRLSEISRSQSDQLNKVETVTTTGLVFDIPISQLVTQLSFSHFIELIKVDTDTKRRFYEAQTIQNNWGVRDLKRAIESLLYERTGLSTNKPKVLQQFNRQNEPKPEALFKNTYLLEFLGLENKDIYTESDLEERIISNLQHFLIELGRGFCFEYRQKRITFDNRHYRIDLVFYHRILKCHVLLDLKIGEFDHADAGQMNMYLNYYKENESHNGDNPPIGIILCSGKNEALVKYATMGLPQSIFVSKYLVNLPSEEELLKIVKEEKGK